MTDLLGKYAVYIFIGLLLAWVAWVRWLGPMMSGVERISIEEYKARFNGKPHVLLDVRSEREFASDHAPRAMHIPIESIMKRIDEIPRGKPLVVVCASGNRSAMAATALAKAGFEATYNLAGGMAAWRGAGLPVRRGDA